MILKNVDKQEKNTAVFEVETDAAEFEKAVNEAYLKNRSSISIPGFRKGKAPRAVIEGMYGREVFYQEAMDELAPAAYEFGLKESGLKVVGTPSVKDLNVSEERTVCYSFEVSLYPEVTLGQYKGLEAEKPEVSVSDEEVEAELNNTRKRNARMLDIDDRAAQMGDTANIDFDGFLNGERFDGGKAEGYSLELGSNSFVPGFEEQVVGMQIGEEKDLNITFPTEYAPELAGKDVVFKVKLNSLTMPELPELDDEFAKDVSEFDTLEEYKADIKANLLKNKTERAESAFKSEILRQAAENVQAEIPALALSDMRRIALSVRPLQAHVQLPVIGEEFVVQHVEDLVSVDGHDGVPDLRRPAQRTRRVDRLDEIVLHPRVPPSKPSPEGEGTSASSVAARQLPLRGEAK